MNKKMSKRQKDIKSKLMAAICMLLVSSIMMVSTTYAWFTLSTAPEVTGITTAVGANGNLEMALQPYNGDSAAIVSGTEDSTKPAKERNVTWGNLVDLGATETDGTNVYGLDKITLYPAALNFTPGTAGTDGTTGTPSQIKAQPLATPTYGADGRVAGLVEKTITGVYDAGKFVEKVSVGETTVNNAKGVRAVGISSGMSDRELAYRGATASASSADTTAKNMAATALKRNGSVLADVAIDHALGNDGGDSNAHYTKGQVDAMRDVLTALVGDASTDGAFDYIGDALMQYAYADTLATTSDTDFETVRAAFAAVTLETIASDSTFSASCAKMVDQDSNNLFTKLNDSKDAAEEALTALPTGDGPFAWNQISTALEGLVNTQYLKINDSTVSEVMANPGAVASSIMKNGLKLYMASGAGVFADIADFCGDYSASIVIPELSYGDITVPDVEATMLTQTSANPVYLKKAQQTVAAFSGTGGAATQSITEFYGYIIDMAFRTNAAGSNLMLQQTGIDRIYNEAGNEGTNPETMGGGAYMQFTTLSTTFTETAMENLMGAIRIVFFETDSMNIVGYARLDAANMDPDTSAGIKMPIMMTDAAGVAKADNKIMALEQNQVHELSVMVYLDGNVVENKDVAYDVAQSMEGKMNLQFSSDAILKPMEYKDLKEGTSSIEPSTPTIPDGATEMTAVKVNGSAATAYFQGDTVAVYVPDYNDGDTIAISVGGTTATGSVTQGVLTFSYTGVAADTAVEVTITPAGG